jgi:hypothetical protein
MDVRVLDCPRRCVRGLSTHCKSPRATPLVQNREISILVHRSLTAFAKPEAMVRHSGPNRLIP